jgi:hypothetical protein
MIRVETAFACAALFALSAGTFAQQRPNFSGTWIVVTPAGAAGQEETILQDEATLTRGHASEGGGHSFTYKLDGTETRQVMSSHGEDIVTLARASWDGDRLVITEATTYPDGRKRDAKSVWSLDSQGQLVIEFTERVAGKPPAAVKRVSKKKA